MTNAIPPPPPPTTPPWDTPPPTGGGGPLDPPGLEPIPWETPGRPILRALFETVKLLLQQPDAGYARVPLHGDFVRPIAFAAILGWVGATLSVLYDALIPSPFSRIFPGEHEGPFAGSVLANGLIMLFAPVGTVIGSFFSSALIHGALMVLGGASRGFGATLRAICYSGATSPLAVIPILGPFVAVLWTWFLQVRGIAVLHGLPTGKATVAVLLPTILCCACGAWLWSALLFSLFAGLR
ncbi:MAG: YIP1 family protein [Candidatus Eisenbacteria bacterium]|nr:YIP1 family protein [Candidatus Eisenbacteria bacterium]MCC7141850.1 YIP1 family protein [Candidatus Eisenbacteria bacterium]